MRILLQPLPAGRLGQRSSLQSRLFERTKHERNFASFVLLSALQSRKGAELWLCSKSSHRLKGTGLIVSNAVLSVILRARHPEMSDVGQKPRRSHDVPSVLTTEAPDNLAQYLAMRYSLGSVCGTSANEITDL